MRSTRSERGSCSISRHNRISRAASVLLQRPSVTRESVKEAVMTPSRPRHRRRKQARPGEILTAALDCFAERGYTATRLDDVAARAGITKGTVYLYYPNKEELFKAVVRKGLVPNLERIEAAAGAAETV